MNNEEQKTPFDITIYPCEEYTSYKGEEKKRYVVPDDVFEEHLKELPDGTRNESNTYRASFGGKLKAFGADPEADREIQKAGGEALQAELKQRRKINETIDIILRKKASKVEIEDLGLEAGATKQDAMVTAIIQKAIDLRDVPAFNSIRDTVGEKAAEVIDVNAQIYEGDHALLNKVKDRMKIE